jgi:hypothetical protein
MPSVTSFTRCRFDVTFTSPDQGMHFLGGAQKAIMKVAFLCRDSMKSTPALFTPPAKTRIIRAVASSTAIETGQSIKELEALLKAQTSKYQQLSLAAAIA